MFHTCTATTPASEARKISSHQRQSQVHAHAAATISARPSVTRRGKSQPRTYQCGLLLKLMSVPLTSHRPASASAQCSIASSRVSSGAGLRLVVAGEHGALGLLV